MIFFWFCNVRLYKFYGFIHAGTNAFLIMSPVQNPKLMIDVPFVKDGMQFGVGQRMVILIAYLDKHGRIVEFSGVVIYIP